MKITLAEWTKFQNHWSSSPDGRNWYWEDQMVPNETEDGVEISGIDPGTKFTLTGYMGWQGNGDPRPAGCFGEWRLEAAIKKWRKMSAFETRVIDIPKEKFAEVRAALAEFGIAIENDG